MLPEAEHEPPSFFEPLIGITVPFYIADDLFRPVAGISPRRYVVLGASVPVTPVDEDGYLDRTEHHVRCSAKIGQRTCRNAVAQALGMN